MMQVKMLHPEAGWISEGLIRTMARDTMDNQYLDFDVEGASIAECIAFLIEYDEYTFGSVRG